jgi:hypothetical protein
MLNRPLYGQCWNLEKISLTMTTIDQLKQFRQGVYTILGNAKDAYLT